MLTTMKRILLSLAGLLAAAALFAQNSFVHEQSDGYVWPDDPAVLEKLDQWQDLKFGVLMHWGLYSVPGIVESWNACPRCSTRSASTRSSGPTSSRTRA